MYQQLLTRTLPAISSNIIVEGKRWYASSGEILVGERRLSNEEVVDLLLTTEYLGLLEHSGFQGLGSHEVMDLLTNSLLHDRQIPFDDKIRVLHLVNAFNKLRPRRSAKPFDEIICEVLWTEFQFIPYKYPSKMLGVVNHGLLVLGQLKDGVLQI
jgi:hypothetical protein